MAKKVELADRVDLDMLPEPGASSVVVASVDSGAVASGVEAPARPAPGDLPARPPGRLAGSDEVARRLAAMQAVPGMAESIGNILAEGERLGLTHEITDAEALRLAARANAAADVAAIAGPPPTYLPAPDRAEIANLPALLGRNVAPAGRDVANAAGRDLSRPEDGIVVPAWMTIYQAPSYIRQVIRALGDATFATFPCYEEHRRVARAAGEDPLGSIRCLANINGAPNRPEEVNHVAAWIAANGVVVDHMQMRFPAALPRGYEPRVILAAIDDISYLLVDESVDRGAHANAQYVYAWKGGMDFYARNPDGLRRIGGLAPDRQGIAPARVAPPAPGNAVRRLPPVARALPPPPPMVGERLDIGARRRARRDIVAKLPEAPPSASSGSEAVKTLRALGFLPFGTPSGPVLRKALDDGEIQVAPEKGHALANSPSLVARVLDGQGATLHEFTYDGGDIMAQAEAAGPRPFG